MRRALRWAALLSLLALTALLAADTPAAVEAASEQVDDDTFVPSETVPADSAVSFPVDI